MRKIKLALINLSLFLFGVLLMSGCAPTLGPAFHKTDYVPDDIGLVYIYRPAKAFGGGVSYDVKANGKVVTTLYSGGYYPYLTDQDEIEFSAKTETTSSVTIGVKAGQTYYLKGTVGIGFLVGRPHLVIVPNEIGEKEIAECKLIPEKKEK